MMPAEIGVWSAPITSDPPIAFTLAGLDRTSVPSLSVVVPEKVLAAVPPKASVCTPFFVIARCC